MAKGLAQSPCGPHLYIQVSSLLTCRAGHLRLVCSFLLKFVCKFGVSLNICRPARFMLQGSHSVTKLVWGPTPPSSPCVFVSWGSIWGWSLQVHIPDNLQFFCQPRQSPDSNYQPEGAPEVCGKLPRLSWCSGTGSAGKTLKNPAWALPIDTHIHNSGGWARECFSPAGSSVLLVWSRIWVSVSQSFGMSHVYGVLVCCVALNTREGIS